MKVGRDFNLQTLHYRLVGR